MNGKEAPIIGFLPEILGTWLIIVTEAKNFLLKRQEKVSFSVMLQDVRNNEQPSTPRYSGVGLSCYTYYISPIEIGLL